MAELLRTAKDQWKKYTVLSTVLIMLKITVVKSKDAKFNDSDGADSSSQI